MSDPKHLHVDFHRESISPDATAAVKAAVQRASEKRSRDEAAVGSDCLHLHTPDGLGRSVLTAEMARPRAAAMKDTAHTMRNWATVTRLLQMLGRDS